MNGFALGINRQSVFAACRASGVDIDPIFAAQGDKELRFDESSLPKSSLGPFQRRFQPRFLLPLSSLFPFDPHSFPSSVFRSVQFAHTGAMPL